MKKLIVVAVMFATTLTTGCHIQTQKCDHPQFMPALNGDGPVYICPEPGE